jgi:hypothetical protein
LLTVQQIAAQRPAWGGFLPVRLQATMLQKRTLIGSDLPEFVKPNLVAPR